MTASGVILIIDDNIHNINVVAEHLHRLGHTIIIARNGEIGLQRAKYAHPDLILLDVMMPGIDGFETCRRLKADPETKDMPVLFMTALHNLEDKVKGFEVGGVDYITKPVQILELLARVNAHLTIRQLQKELQLANAELSRMAHIDSLTQIANRRRFDEYLYQMWRHLAESQSPLSVILCDIDYFKIYNDHYGHQAGDECLRQVAQALIASIRRSTDLVARYGGEEFVVILPHTPQAGSQTVAKHIQEQIKRLQIPHPLSPCKPYLTVSLGLATAVPKIDQSADYLVAMADKALYQAKGQGRNNIVTLSAVWGDLA